jgi:bifunctional UDP-N-acetylglucosamine pyrophosphorylase/glucosamine-1-phosphate N-acetyltransferase
LLDCNIMKNSPLNVVVLAAGAGKRMRSDLPKVLHPLAGKALLAHVLDTARGLGAKKICVVIGHGGDSVRAALPAADIQWAVQEPQLGTGHALLQALPFLDQNAPTLVLYGDVPLTQAATLQRLIDAAGQDHLALLTAHVPDSHGYGRIVRVDGKVTRIVEEKDADDAERAISEINTGILVASAAALSRWLPTLGNQNAQGEYYLTDIVRMAVSQGQRVAAVTLQDPDEGLGVNTRQQLAAAEQVVRHQIRERWLDAGVTMRDPGSVWIDADVTIGKDTVLYPHVVLEGNTVIGEETTIRSGVRITDCMIGNHVELLDSSVLSQSRVDDEAHVGPFVHLRPGVVVRRRAKVGNFVEMKKTELGEGSKANHLSYLGDATIAEGVNIGAGTITCNYDGQKKHHTVIGKNVFLGSDTQLVAPVTIGEGAVIAAGTTVTQNVPADSLAIARVPQTNRMGWVAKRRALLERTAPSVVSVKTPAKQVRAKKQNTAAKSKKRAGRSSKG